MNINPWLLLTALVAGYVFSWYVVVVRTVTREVAAPLATADAAASASSASSASSAYAVVDEPDAAASGRRVVDPQPLAGASAYRAADEPDASSGVDWKARLDAAAGRLLGSRYAARDAEPVEVSELTEVEELTEPGEPTEAMLPPLPDSVDAPADGSRPEGYSVKGDRGARLYLVEADSDFGRARPDIWFVDERAALDAGYAHYERKPRSTSDDGGSRY